MNDVQDHEFVDWIDAITYLKQLGLEINISYDKLKHTKEHALKLAYDFIDSGEFEKVYKNFLNGSMDKNELKDNLNITYGISDNFISTSHSVKVAIIEVSVNIINCPKVINVTLWDTQDGTFPLLLNEYVNEILKKERRTPAWLAEETNINQQSLYGKLKNNTFSAIDLIKIGKALNIDLNILKDNLLLE